MIIVKEPLWRVVLNWGCVIYFLGLPALALLVALTDITTDPRHPDAPKFLAGFHYAVSGLVAAMAGLNSWDRYKMNGMERETKTQGRTVAS